MANTYAHYARILQDSIPMSREEEARFLTVAQTGSECERDTAEQKLLQANLRFVFQVVRRFAHVGTDDFDIAFVSGMHGFIRGIRLFERTRGLKLISYAIWWIKREILTDLQVDKTRFAGMTGIRDRRKRLEKELEEFEKLGAGGTLKADEVQARLTEINNAMGPPHIRIGTDRRSAHGEMETQDVVDTRGLDDFFEFESDATNRKIISLSLKGIDNELDRRLVSLYYGLDGGNPHTYDELGSAVEKMAGRRLSRERIRQRLTRSLVNMRRKLEKNNVKRYDMCYTHESAT